MRIGIDVRYLSHGLIGGVHTYVANFIPAILRVAPEHQFFLYADTKRALELREVPAPCTVRYLDWRNPLSSIQNDFSLRHWMARDQIEMAHFPANYGFAPRGARVIVTVHDAINLMPWFEIMRGHPKNPRTLGMMTYLHFVTQAALRRADLITTVSTFSGKEIARYGRVDPQKIAVVPSACPTDIQRVADSHQLAEVRQRLQITRPFILADAFKNPGVLIRAWHLLSSDLQKRVEIVFFARSSQVLPVVERAIAEGLARLLVRPARRDLCALYSMAEVFVFPSWIEGFGLPVLEAMTCGAPVITSDRGALPEVVGDAAILIDAEDEGALATHIETILTNPRYAESLRARGLERATQFSWQKNAQQMLECYMRVMNGSSVNA